MLLNKPLRFPSCQFIPGARFENETVFAGEGPDNRKLAVEASTQFMKLFRCARYFSATNNFSRIHLSISNGQRKPSR